jgi:threonyl-tRNA synthetase
MKYMRKSFRFARKSRNSRLVDKAETIGKKIRDAEMQKNPVYADCRRGKRRKWPIRRHGQEGKGNITVTIEDL